MKLRIRENSLRFRLLRSEVEHLGIAETVSEETRFGPGPHEFLKYTISISDEAASITARFLGNEILVLLPRLISHNWTRGDAVTLEADQAIGGDGPLSILIEKDFVCLERPNDRDNVDAFPHPNAVC